MGLFDRWFSGRMSSIVEVHTLHPVYGYKQERWEIGRDVELSIVQRKAEAQQLYVVYAFEEGQPVKHFLTKELFMNALQQYQEIEQGVEESLQQIFS